jgi:exopolysaccharide biosynthesis polyprenyl glycosylphosphotransferase
MALNRSIDNGKSVAASDVQPDDPRSDFYLELARLSAASWRQRRLARYMRLGATGIADLVAGFVSSLLLLGPLDPKLPVDVAGEVSISYRSATFVIIPFWLVSLALVGGYQRRAFLTITDEWLALIKSVLVLFFGFALFEFATKAEFSRGFTGRLVVTYLVAGAISRSLFRPLTRIRPRVLLLGDEQHLADARGSLSEDGRLEIVASLALNPNNVQSAQIVSLFSRIARSEVNTVIIVGGIGDDQAVSNALIALDVLHCDILAVPDATPTPTAGGSAVVLGNNLLVRIGPTPSHRFVLLKWLLDRVGALVLLVVLSPLLVAIAIGVRISSSGPALFRQSRVGRAGRPFKVVKFRTMRPDAEQLLHSEGLWDLYVASGFKLPAEVDPRITTIGRVLRSTSLDELPQLVNVLLGSMSLIGPRPIVPPELALYESLAPIYLGMRPGLSGLWQVSGRSDIGFPERAYLDREYFIRQCLQLDIQIAFRTIAVVMQRRGAY